MADAVHLAGATRVHHTTVAMEVVPALLSIGDL